MYYKKFIQGILLTQIVENNIFDAKEIEDTCKLDIDCKGLLNISEKYSYKTEIEGATVEDKKIILLLMIEPKSLLK